MLRSIRLEGALRDVDATSLSSAQDQDIDDEETDMMLHSNDSLSSLGSSIDMDDEVKTVAAPPPPSIMNRMPRELLMYTFAHLTCNKDLQECMMVCRIWSVCAVGLLWHRPSVSSWENLQSLLKTLSKPCFFSYPRFIRRLNLSTFGHDIVDGQLRPFLGCNRIERLTLTNCNRLSDITLLFLVRHNPGLVALDATGIKSLSSDTIRELSANCNNLQGLNISHCKAVSSESLDKVARHCRYLKRLKLNNCDQLTSQPIISLSLHARHLMEIDLHGVSSLTDDAVTSLLTNCSHLRELRLAHCMRITDSAFTNMPVGIVLDSLRILDLTECVELTDAGVMRVVSASPKLRNLGLAKCRQVGDPSLQVISRLGRNLHYLHMGHCARITDAGIINLAEKCDRLRYIDFACCLQLTDESVKYLAALPKLKRVGLVKCDHITDHSIFAFAQPKSIGWTTVQSPLERVHLSYCRNLTISSIQYLLNHCPGITHLSLTGVQAFLREDLINFCRPPPGDFNEHQRNLFCVFSGKGVRELTIYLNHLEDANARVLSQMALPTGQIQIRPRIFQNPLQMVNHQRENDQNRHPVDHNIHSFIHTNNLHLVSPGVFSSQQFVPPNQADGRDAGHFTLPHFDRSTEHVAQPAPDHGFHFYDATQGSQSTPAAWFRTTFIPTTETWNPESQSSIMNQIPMYQPVSQPSQPPPQPPPPPHQPVPNAHSQTQPESSRRATGTTTNSNASSGRTPSSRYWDYTWVMNRYRQFQDPSIVASSTAPSVPESSSSTQELPGSAPTSGTSHQSRPSVMSIDEMISPDRGRRNRSSSVGPAPPSTTPLQQFRHLVSVAESPASSSRNDPVRQPPRGPQTQESSSSSRRGA